MKTTTATSTKENPSNNIAQDVLATLPTDTPIYNFALIYLQAIPESSAKDYSIEELKTFIQERYDYVEKSLKKELNHRCYLQKTDTDKIDTGILEVVCADARYLVESIEAVLAKHKHSITLMFHPIFSISKDKKGNLNSLEKSTSRKNPLFSTIYIEFNNVENEKSLELLNKEINTCLIATQLSHSANQLIHEKLDTVHSEVKNTPTPVSQFHKEWVDLINWLKDSNFSFFGSTEFELNIKKDTIDVKQIKKSGLGILDDKYTSIEKDGLLKTLSTQVERLKNYRSPFLFDVIKVPCPIKTSAHLMRLSLKIPISKTKIKEYNFIGLLRRSSLHVKNTDTPIIRLKIKTFLEDHEILTGSYDYNQIIRYYTVTPKYELFRTPSKLLASITNDLLSTTNPNDVYLFNYGKIDPSRHLYMAVLPTNILSSGKIDKIKEFFINKIEHTDNEVVVIQGTRQTRLHLYFDQTDSKSKNIDNDILELELKSMIKPWKDLLLTELLNNYSPTKGKSLYKKYVNAFPSHYKVMRTTKDTVRDIKYLELVEKTKEIQFNLVPFSHRDSVIASKASILIVYNKNKIDLTNIMPLLQNLNIHVFDEITTRIGPPENVISYIHSFRVVDSSLKRVDEEKFFPKLISILEAVFKGHTANDTLNGLVLVSGMHWRDINILQTYRNYYLQLDSVYSKEKINQTLLKYTESTSLLIEYFTTKFSTEKEFKDSKYREENLLPPIKKSFFDSLKKVEELAEDIILKQFFTLINHTLRTNFYIKKENNDNFISIKIDSKTMKVAHPTPYREIYVYDTEMEGCHLRFGPVSRGGLRWSSRPFDYRKEVLGLVNTQQTKNVVIVPEGSKGCFITKNKTDDFAKNGMRQYQKFIMGLLDITDSLDVKSNIIHPESVIRYDQADPYLVVAADKGTAQFSDIANDISDNYKFWLGDGFASGGSNGYNHKEVGITAKGAWECVKLHFLESGKDIDKETFTVVGIGDMGGDVFGNGMLLSDNIELQGAFNHIHIFIDPTPDSKKSFKERSRLFDLERSTWKDYNAKLISKGGGVFDRNAREIKLTPEIKKLINSKKDILNGEELIKALLKIKADLLWAGGIGTYIKADYETNMQVSDPANDSLRINHSESQFSILGEGANLCVTANARYELSKNNTRVNTDFIDNSAGVNMSDYEVNIKILLKTLLETKTIKSAKERNDRLEKATDEVTELVLINNRAQHQLLSMDAIKTVSNTTPFIKLVNHLVSTKAIQADQESIYAQSKINNCIENKKPLPRPLLASLQSYVKMELFSELNENPLPENDYLDSIYKSYFPKAFIKDFESFIMNHPLKKEILNTLITNTIVNQAGMTFFNDIQETSGRSLTEITSLYLTVNLGLGADKLRNSIHSQNISSEKKYLALIELEQEIKNEILHILQLPFKLDLEHVELIQKTLSSLKASISATQPPLEASIKKWQGFGFNKTIAKELSMIHYTENVCDLIYLNFKLNTNITSLLQILFEIDALFEFKTVKRKLQVLNYSNTWEFQQIETLGLTLRAQKLNLASFVLDTVAEKDIKELSQNSLKTLFQEQFPGSNQYFSTLQQIKVSRAISISTISVLINKLNLFSIHKK
jgi:glutamate dehydrogenase